MRINLLTLVGIVLVILGIVAFSYRGIPYTSGEAVIEAGSPQVSVSTRKTIPMSPLLIGLALVSGAALIAIGSTKSY